MKELELNAHSIKLQKIFLSVRPAKFNLRRFRPVKQLPPHVSWIKCDSLQVGHDVGICR